MKTPLHQFIEEYKSFVIIPDTSIDSLLAAGVLYRRLLEHKHDVRVSIDQKILIDYPQDPAILVNLPGLNKDKHLTLTQIDENTSLTGTVVSFIDKIMGAENWDKLLAVIAGHYRGLYDLQKSGFPGVEKEYQNDLINEKILVEIPAGLKLWGARRLSLVTALYRTLMPFIPGISGNKENAFKLVAEVFKVPDPFMIRVKEITLDKEKNELLLEFMKRIVARFRDQKLTLKLIGDHIITIPELGEGFEIEAHELVGALVVYNSLRKENPEDIILMVVDKSILAQILITYDEKIENVTFEVSQYIDAARSGEPIGELTSIERPDLVIDILSYMGFLPPTSSVKIQKGDSVYTSLRELIRVGVKPEDAYSQCEENQLCKVK